MLISTGADFSVEPLREVLDKHIKRLGRFERTSHGITGDRTGQPNSRGIGWEYVHVCVENASRLAFTQTRPDEKATSALAHLKAAVAWYASMGIKVAQVMTDNGSCYKSHAFKTTCTKPGIRHIRTKPYTPKTNGKAKRFIQTALREGPKPVPIKPQTNAQRICPSGHIYTIGTAHTQR